MTGDKDENLSTSPGEREIGEDSKMNEAKSPSGDGDTNVAKKVDLTTKQQEQSVSLVGTSNDNNSSSNSSESRSRNGKGGGYTADCSSLSHFSDSSSSEASKNESTSSTRDKHKAKNFISAQTSKINDGLGNLKPSMQELKAVRKGKSKSTKNATKILPQWQGVRVYNPMDPRIDLSTVNMISASELYSKEQICGQRNVERPGEEDKNISQEPITTSYSIQEESPNQSTLLKQYNELMNSLEESTSIQALSQSKVGVCYEPHVGNKKSSMAEESDSNSSMLVLARVKRKYQNDSDVPAHQNLALDQYGTSMKSDQILPNIPLQQPSTNSKKESNSVHSQQSSVNSTLCALPSSISSQSSSMKNQSSKIVTDSVGVSGGGTGSTGGSGGSGGSDPARTETNSENTQLYQETDKKISASELSATQERLALKKRKRLDKRREYEEEVQRKHQDHLQSKGVSTTYQVFREGEMISMEEALAFTSSARLVVQAESPYLAVHVNAAFSRFTGMHNSRIIGRPLSKILSLIDSNQVDWSATSTREKQQQEDKNEDSNVHPTSIKSSQITRDEEPGTINYDEDTSNDKLKGNTPIEELSMGNLNLKRIYKVTTIVDKSDDKNGNASNSANEGSNNSSITSKDDSLDSVRGVMSICVIVSTPTRGQNKSNQTRIFLHQVQHDPSSSIKKQKQQSDETTGMHPANNDSVDRHTLHLSHYLIQLFPVDDEGQQSNQRVDEEKEENISVSSTDSPTLTCG